MRFTHKNGEDAAGRRVSVAPHLKPEVEEDGTFEVSEDTLQDRGVDPDSARDRLEDAGHSYEEQESEPEESSEDEEQDKASGKPQEPDVEEDGNEAATKTDLMDLKKDQLVTMAESVEDVDPDQNKEPLAEDLAGQVVLEDEGE